MSLKQDALKIIDEAIRSADPFDATRQILQKLLFDAETLTVFSIGKAAIPMAAAAEAVFGKRIKNGLIVTKYNHTGTYRSDCFRVIEAAHPVSDDNSIFAAEEALKICEALGAGDVCIVLLSGGGSALFEKSVIAPEMQRDITEKLLARGATIDSINAVRRRISLVKGGRLAAAAYPAAVYTVALSDVLSNDKSVIASGITVKDELSANDVLGIVETYLPEYKSTLCDIIQKEEPILINDKGFFFAGDIHSLCDAAQNTAKKLGYEVFEGSRALTGEASEVCEKLIDAVSEPNKKCAYIYGGETTVTLKGDGLGGRNQEMALKAAIRLNGRKGILFASVGSDGTDGPTDAAGGIADGDTYARMRAKGVDPEKELDNNNSNFALCAADSLIVTGPTGTNVNDLTFVLTE